MTLIVGVLNGKRTIQSDDSNRERTVGSGRKVAGQRGNDSAKSRNNLMGGSTNCASFAIKRCTCAPLEYNRGFAVWKKDSPDLVACIPCVFVPARRRAMEKTNFPCGERMAGDRREKTKERRNIEGEGRGWKKGKLTCDFLDSLTDRAKENERSPI